MNEKFIEVLYFEFCFCSGGIIKQNETKAH